MSTQTHVSHRLDMRPQWQVITNWDRLTTPESFQSRADRLKGSGLQDPCLRERIWPVKSFCDRQGREGEKTSSLDEEIDRFRSAKSHVR